MNRKLVGLGLGMYAAGFGLMFSSLFLPRSTESEKLAGLHMQHYNVSTRMNYTAGLKDKLGNLGPEGAWQRERDESTLRVLEKQIDELRQNPDVIADDEITMGLFRPGAILAIAGGIPFGIGLSQQKRYEEGQ